MVFQWTGWFGCINGLDVLRRLKRLGGLVCDNGLSAFRTYNCILHLVVQNVSLYMMVWGVCFVGVSVDILNCAVLMHWVVYGDSVACWLGLFQCPTFFGVFQLAGWFGVFQRPCWVKCVS